MTAQFNAGDRVQTKYGDGTVIYKRMAAPDYAEAAMYSVYLDHCRDRPDYSGTVVLPGELQSYRVRLPMDEFWSGGPSLRAILEGPSTNPSANRLGWISLRGLPVRASPEHFSLLKTEPERTVHNERSEPKKVPRITP